MKILVYNIAASSGGALSILHEYYEKAKRDTTNEWHFLISTPELSHQPNIHVHRFPAVKKSWIHRLIFDYFKAQSIIKEINPDKILSLQNIIVPRIKNFDQEVYVHQSLPFYEIKFSLIQNPKFWVYQNIISRLMFKSIRKSIKTIVQTEWMKNAVLDKVNVSKDKIVVDPPEVNIQVKEYFNPKPENYRTFFYPAGASFYKNHRVIVSACEQLKKEKNDDFSVYFTLNGNETKHIKAIKNRITEQNLPIYFIGQLSREDVYNFYSRAVLIFPSYIETFGLPLLEAKKHKTPIIASDMPYSKEILDDYEDTYFFQYEDSSHLANLMETNINSEFK